MMLSRGPRPVFSKPSEANIYDPDTVKCYAILRENSSPILAQAFAAGCNGTVITENDLYPGNAFLFGSPVRWKLFNTARALGKNWYYADHAYFRRGEYYRITRNALQHDGKEGKPNYSRWRTLKLPKPAPWRKGRSVLICPPDSTFASLMGFDAAAWCTDVRRTLEHNTDRPLVWRDRKNHNGTLAEALVDAHALVTYTSNAAVEALMLGVPVFCTAPCASYLMGRPDVSRIEDPFYPDDRARWAAVLAANQWTLAEIAAGQAWRKLRE